MSWRRAAEKGAPYGFDVRAGHVDFLFRFSLRRLVVRRLRFNWDGLFRLLDAFTHGRVPFVPLLYYKPMPSDKKKNRAAAALGRLGGKARAKKLSKSERSASAKKAALARWDRARAEDSEKERLADTDPAAPVNA